MVFLSTRLRLGFSWLEKIKINNGQVNLNQRKVMISNHGINIVKPYRDWSIHFTFSCLQTTGLDENYQSHFYFFDFSASSFNIASFNSWKLWSFPLIVKLWQMGWKLFISALAAFYHHNIITNIYSLFSLTSQICTVFCSKLDKVNLNSEFPITIFYKISELIYIYT